MLRMLMFWINNWELPVNVLEICRKKLVQLDLKRRSFYKILVSVKRWIVKMYVIHGINYFVITIFVNFY